MAWRLLIALAIALAAGAGASGALRDDEPSSGSGSAGGGAGAGLVVKVVDGDTIHVATASGREKVRYIGVDTPETRHPSKGVQCFGKAASAFNARLVDGERVRLARDVEARDRYGRLLAYVYRERDGRFVNAELARRGYAVALTVPPNVRFAERFDALARAARDAGRGLWAAC